MKISSIVFGLFFSYWVLAEEYCHLHNTADEEQSGFVLKLGNKGLVCLEAGLSRKLSPQIKQYPKEQIKMVRGNIYELSRTGVTLLHHAHGYNLVAAQEGDLDSVDHHLTVIKLKDYRPIIQVSKTHKKGNADPIIQQLVDAIDADQWLSDVTTLSSWSRRTGSSGNVSAADWIAEKMNQLNLQVSQPQFSASGTLTKNIMGVQTGTVRPDDWYVIGAHMDSIAPSANAPGAVDNASGCAAVLEIARIASGYQFEGTLIFICYSGEEQGLHGSRFHVSTLIANNESDQIKAALTLDMIGYSSDSQREVLFESSGTYQWLMDMLANNISLYAPSMTAFTTTNYFGSDHVPYIDNNMPGVLSIDNDYGMYPSYHQSSDLPENIILDQAVSIIKANIATMSELAVVVDGDLIFKSQFE